MKIAVLGAGPVGSTFAFHFARAGHEVTAIDRGERLAQLRADGAVVTHDGLRAEVRVAPALDASIAYDLVLVAVRSSQVDTVLPALRESAAKSVMFVFSTFGSLDTLRDAVGAERFVFAFPGFIASLFRGKLLFRMLGSAQRTLATSGTWVGALLDVGVPADLERDMQSWLRTRAVLAIAMTAIGVDAHGRGSGVSWGDAKRYGLALREGFALVRRLGSKVNPPELAALERSSTATLAAILWSTSKIPMAREALAFGAEEPRSLIDAMVAADPENTRHLRSIRP